MVTVPEEIKQAIKCLVSEITPAKDQEDRIKNLKTLRTLLACDLQTETGLPICDNTLSADSLQEVIKLTETEPVIYKDMKNLVTLDVALALQETLYKQRLARDQYYNARSDKRVQDYAKQIMELNEKMQTWVQNPKKVIDC